MLPTNSCLEIAAHATGVVSFHPLSISDVAVRNERVHSFVDGASPWNFLGCETTVPGSRGRRRPAPGSAAGRRQKLSLGCRWGATGAGTMDAMGLCLRAYGPCVYRPLSTGLWDVILSESGSITLALLAVPLRVLAEPPGEVMAARGLDGHRLPITRPPMWWSTSP